MPGESPSARLTAALARLSAEASVVLASPARRNRALAVSGALLGVLYYLRRTAPGPAKPAAKDGKEKEKDAGRGKVDAEFFRQLSTLLKIAVPSPTSPEALTVYTHTLFLVLRTWLSVLVADLDGQIVRDLIRADLKGFVRGLAWWFAVAIPATYTNSMIRYLQSLLAIRIRTRLTRHITDLYLSKNTYHTILLLNQPASDQLITTDLAKFCASLAALYSNLGKPILDMLIFNYQLSRSIGGLGTLLLFGNYLITARLIRAVTPPFGMLAAKEAELEGHFRSAHARIITNAEEIAFYNGGTMELQVLGRLYSDLMRHVNKVYRLRIAYNMFEDMIIKYAWSAAGLLIASLPVFFPAIAGVSIGDGETEREKTGDRTASFVTNKRLMISLADAGGRLMYSYKDLSELSGYTSRVYSLLTLLRQLNADKYPSHPRELDGETYDIADTKGNISEDRDGVTFENVPVITPAADAVLVKDLSFELKKGDHLLITGPNGSGKTSVLRLLARLWPVFRGHIGKPRKAPDSVFYLPQRPYLVVGTLRDQVIYPDSVEDMKKKGRTDKELEEILGKVYLGYLVDREGGWGTVKEWKDVFSGGEKQRIQWARLFYHSPAWAVLDEATSAVSADVEGLMYASAADHGITLISISHRPALFKYHTYLLRLGEGSGTEWTFERIESPEEVMHSLEGEIKALEARLEGVEDLKRRLADVNAELRLNLGPAIGKGARRSIV